jgi:hypothetical protein
MVQIWIFKIKAIMYWVKKGNIFLCIEEQIRFLENNLYSNLETHSSILVFPIFKCGVHSETDHDMGVWQVVWTSHSGSDFVPRGNSRTNSSEPRYLTIT